MLGRALFLALLVGGCSARTPSLVVWYDAERMVQDGVDPLAADRPQLLVGWDGWRTRSDWVEDGEWRRISFDLSPGTYQYAFLVGGKVLPDPLRGQSAFVQDPLGVGSDPFGVEVSEVQVPIVDPPPAHDFSDEMIYQVVVDRFRPPGPPATPGDRAGGTLDGVRAAIEEGYFDKLGVTALWLSPLYQNPTGEHVGRDGHLYEAYHGYWPSEPRTVEPKFGGETALEALVASAHAHGLKLIADVVPNHVYQTHPYVTDHPEWINPSCVCGAIACDWGSYIETCWFGPELPDLNWRRPDAASTMTEDLVWWLDRFSLDGIRIDAVPMMPRAASRRIARAVRQAHGAEALVLGEDYTGPGDAGREQIRAYLDQKLDGLDSAFDFPLMWAEREAIAHADPTFGFGALEDEVEAGERAWSGSGATMAHMLGNHDTTRFSSEAAGDAGGDPWLQPPAQSTDPTVYARVLIGLAFVMTLPGLPVIYYGDEIGLAGANDPDSRRVLPKQLSPLQQALLDEVERIGRARVCKDDLRHGARTVILVDVDHLVASRGDAIIALSRDRNPSTVTVPMQGGYFDVVSGQPVTIAEGGLTLPPWSAQVLLPAADPCAK